MPIQPADIRFDDRGNAFSETFGDIYFNPDDAAGKTTHIFHRATRFNEQCAALSDHQPLVVGELGFGLGLNFLGTWARFKQLAPPNSRLHYVGIELAPPSHEQLRRALGGFGEWSNEVEQLIAGWPGRVAGVQRVEMDRCSLTLHLGEVGAMLPGISGGMDAWFLDGFAPEKNPAMWSTDVAEQLFARTKPGGWLGSFTAAGHVRRALADAGFAVERLPGDPFKRHIVAAQKSSTCGVPKENFRGRKVVVVGAGWAGLSVAEALHNRGHEVVVVDAEIPGAGASGNRQAVCAPVLDAAASPRQDFYRSAFVLASRRHERCGVLRKPDTQKDAAALRQAAEVYGSLDEWFVWRDAEGFAGQRKDPRVSDPGLKLGCADGGGLWIPTAGLARFAEFAAGVCEKLPESAQRWPWVVSGLQRDGEGWVLKSADGETLEADAVVLACAAAVRKFGPTAEWPLRRIRGQVSHVPATAPGSAPEISAGIAPGSRGSNALDHVVMGEAYLCPADDGVHSVGATFDPNDEETALRAADHEDNRRRAEQTAPYWAAAMDWERLGETTSQSDMLPGENFGGGQVGFRVNTPDYLPMIGPVPDLRRCREVWAARRDASALTVEDLPAVPNLYAVTALGSHGVITAALAASLIADLVDGTPLPCSTSAAHAVHPGRYLLRAEKRRQPIAYPPIA